MPKSKHNQKGSGGPGTYYHGFGPFYAEYPHVLLGGANPGNYEGYGLHAAEYPGASYSLTSPGFRGENAMSRYPEAFGRPLFSGGAKQGKQEVEQIVEQTQQYLKSGNPTWEGLAKSLDEPGLGKFFKKEKQSGQINGDESDVHVILGRYWGRQQ